MCEYTYIKINNIKDKTSNPSNGLKKVIEESVIRIQSTFIPKANPDFEHLFDSVHYWIIEYNNEKKAALREIGFNKSDQPIIAMPDERNHGYWTDNNLTIDDYKSLGSLKIEKQEFEKNWLAFKK